MTKRQGRELKPRVCHHCRADSGYIGPRPFDSVLVFLNGEMLYACSRKCAKAMNWGERKS